MTLVFEYPLWFILLCILFGATGSFFLYYFRVKLEISPFLRYILTGLRFLSLFLISFLLLSPLIRQNIETIEKPLIILGFDNSESIGMTKDSSFYKKDFPDKIRILIENLKKKYEVKTFSLGEGVEPFSELTLNQKKTDLSVFFQEIEDRYVNRNVGAIILASDGIYNKGIDPYYASRKLTFPVYCIPLGDTIQHQDLLLTKISFNPTAFLGDRFPLEILYSAFYYQGQHTQLIVSKGTKVLYTRDIIPGNERTTGELKLFLDASEIGQQVYDIRITPLNGEVSTLNNYQRIIIQVLNSREKIAILYDAPHPDISAIEQALMKTEKYEITASSLELFSGAPEKFNLLIFYQLPSIRSTLKLEPFLKSETSSLFILGTQSDLNSFNHLNTGLVINSSQANNTEALPILNDGFALFTMDRRFSQAFSEYPPLLSPMGTYQYSPLTDVLCYQKIGAVNTRIPQILFSDLNKRKTGIIAGENIWKWRMAEFIAHSNHDVFDDWMNKTVQFLSLKEDKSFFRVKVKNPVSEDEGVSFEAEVFNDSYELVNGPDVNIVITDTNRKTFPYLFNKMEKAYQLNAGLFPVGNYQYKATVKIGQKTFQKSGNFIVLPVNNEAINLVADHQLLYRIASAHEGALIPPENLENIQDQLNERGDIHSISDMQKRFTELIGNPWLLILLIILLSAEWIIRKRSGL